MTKLLTVKATFHFDGGESETEELGRVATKQEAVQRAADAAISGDYGQMARNGGMRVSLELFRADGSLAFRGGCTISAVPRAAC